MNAFNAVASPNYRVRRATLEDIGQLTALWKTMNFPAEDLARRITEFQVAESAAGGLLGAVGMQIAERQGRIHSEAFTDFALADSLRPLLWERLHAVATNYGLLRVWTQEPAPFWHHSGLAKADATALQKLPAGWRGGSAGWLTLKLKEDVEEVISLDQEFAQFMEAEKARTGRLVKRARALKFIVAFLALALLGSVIAAVVFVLSRHPQLPHR